MSKPGNDNEMSKINQRPRWFTILRPIRMENEKLFYMGVYDRKQVYKIRETLYLVKSILYNKYEKNVSGRRQNFKSVRLPETQQFFATPQVSLYILLHERYASVKRKAKNIFNGETSYFKIGCDFTSPNIPTGQEHKGKEILYGACSVEIRNCSVTKWRRLRAHCKKLLIPSN